MPKDEFLLRVSQFNKDKQHVILSPRANRKIPPKELILILLGLGFLRNKKAKAFICVIFEGFCIREQLSIREKKAAAAIGYQNPSDRSSLFYFSYVFVLDFHHNLQYVANFMQLGAICSLKHDCKPVMKFLFSFFYQWMRTVLPYI